MLVRLLTTLAAAIALTGCGGGGEGNPPNGDIRAFNAASGFGPLSFLRVERVEAVLPYKADSGFISVDQDDYNFNIEVARPGSSERRRILTFPASIVAGREYTFVLADDGGGGLEVITLDNEADAAGETESLVDVLHLATELGPVDVYLEAPGMPLAGATPIAAVDLRDQVSGASVPEGDYQLSFTAPGDADTLLFRSATINLAGGGRLLLGVLDAAGGNTTPLSVVALSDVASSAELFDEGVQPQLRIIHAASQSGPVDVILDDDFAQPLATAVAADSVTDYQSLPNGTRNFKVTPAGNSGSILIDQDVEVPQGQFVSLLVAGEPGDLQAGTAIDQNRPLPGIARLRVLGGQVQEGSTNVYIVSPGTDVSEVVPTVNALPFLGISDYLDFLPGNYQLVFTELSTDDVLGTPTDITLQGGMIYGVLVLDDAVQVVRPLLFDDFVP